MFTNYGCDEKIKNGRYTLGEVEWLIVNKPNIMEVLWPFCTDPDEMRIDWAGGPASTADLRNLDNDGHYSSYTDDQLKMFIWNDLGRAMAYCLNETFNITQLIESVQLYNLVRKYFLDAHHEQLGRLESADIPRPELVAIAFIVDCNSENMC